MSQSADDVLKYSQFSIDKTEPFRLRPDLQDVAEYPLPPVRAVLDATKRGNCRVPCVGVSIHIGETDFTEI